MTLVSGNIRFMQIFAGVPLGGGVKRHWGLSTTAIFWRFRWLRLRKLHRHAASSITWRYATPWLQNEWPWMTLSVYFMSTSVFGQQFLNQSVWMPKTIQPLRLCGVLCIARSVIQPMRRHAQQQLMRCFSAVAELLVFNLEPVTRRGKVTKDVEPMSSERLLKIKINLPRYARTSCTAM